MDGATWWTTTEVGNEMARFQDEGMGFLGMRWCCVDSSGVCNAVVLESIGERSLEQSEIFLFKKPLRWIDSS